MILLLLAGCSAKTSNSVGVPQLSHSVEQAISDKLVQLRGVRPKSVACPQSMAPTKGKVYRCTLTGSAGEQLGVTVTMQGGKNFHFAVDQQRTR